MKELFIDSNPLETRVALVEDGRLAELWIERSDKARVVGDIYKGVVSKVLPGLEAAFVNLGLSKDGFLPFDDVSDLFPAAGAEAERTRAKGRKPGLKPGQEVLVQVTKEPMGGKGPRVTAWISLPGRFAVLLPGEDQLGISQRIESEEERKRLRGIFSKLLPPGFGLVVRTAAEGQEPKALQRDLKELLTRWREIEKKSQRAAAPARLYSEPAQVFNVLRDVAAYGIDRVVVEGGDLFREIKKHLAKTDPSWKDIIEEYRGELPLFWEKGLEKQIGQAMSRQVRLKSGGRLVIEQTEALTVIDVNSGRYVGRRAAEETLFRVNLEAAAEIARQLRLRDIGGIIVVDFIDMESQAKRERVLSELRKAAAEDRSKPKVHDFSPLGLVEINRKRTKPSLWHAFSENCPACLGSGRVLHPAALAAGIMRGLTWLGKQIRSRQIILATNPGLADYIEDQAAEAFSQLSQRLGCRIFLEEDEALKMGAFRVVDRASGKAISLEDFAIDSGADLE